MMNNAIILVSDNSGARRVKIIQKPLAKKVGSILLTTIRRYKPSSNFEKGQKEQAMFVRQKNVLYRKDGSCIRFGHTNVIMMNKRGGPRGKRLYGPVAKETRLKRMKILTRKVF